MVVEALTDNSVDLAGCFDVIVVGLTAELSKGQICEQQDLKGEATICASVVVMRLFVICRA